MKLLFKTLLGFGFILSSLMLSIWGTQVLDSSAANVNVLLTIPVPICGNNIKEGVFEECDDGGVSNGDGCDGQCDVESGYACVGSPSCCSFCGDNSIECAEECDDGKQCANGVSCTSDANCAGIGNGLCLPRDNDGCSAVCSVEVSGGGGGGPQDIIISDITAYPELRSGAVGSNYDTGYYFSILDADNQKHTSYYSHNTLLNTNNSGVGYPYATVGGLSAGVYDAVFKSKAHLSFILDNVYLQLGEAPLNFTNPTNQPAIGSLRLVAGDIDNSGTSPSTFGDDVINSVDLSIILDRMGDSDPTGKNIRANLNQDGFVNQSDLNILLGNLDKEVIL